MPGLQQKRTLNHIIVEGQMQRGMQNANNPAQQARHPREIESSSEAGEESPDEDKQLESGFCSLAKESTRELTEQDVVQLRWEALAERYLRGRPTLPAPWGDASVSLEDTSSGWRLPLFKFQINQYVFDTDYRRAFESSPHARSVEDLCSPSTEPWLQHTYDVNGAISVQERSQWPRLGAAVTRRVMRNMSDRLTDYTNRCLACCLRGAKHNALGPGASI